jgi:ketosteroid isomerase-like protein
LRSGRAILQPGSQENVDAVSRIYAVWSHEGSPGPSELIDPDIDWVNRPETVEGTRIDELFDVGDQVVVIATVHGGERDDGSDAERRQGYLWTFRDAKAIRFQSFDTPDDALTAAGVHCSR